MQDPTSHRRFGKIIPSGFVYDVYKDGKYVVSFIIPFSINFPSSGKMFSQYLERYVKVLTKGRATHIITPNSSVDEGVFLGPNYNILVNSKSSSALKNLYENIRKKLEEYLFSSDNNWNDVPTREKEKNCREEDILKIVYDTVQSTFPQRPNTIKLVEELVNRYRGEDFSSGTLHIPTISLDIFIKEGVGYCIHTALTCATLLELLKKDGIIKGTPTIDLGYIKNTGLMGHAWCKYTTPTKEVWVLDATCSFIGKMEDAQYLSKIPVFLPRERGLTKEYADKQLEDH